MSEALALARQTLVGSAAWVVGGLPRDRALGRDTRDVDLLIDGDPEHAARALAQAARAFAFELSQEFGAWRVVARGREWQIDISAVRAGALEHDLALRDFTVNAMAEPLDGGALLDPLGGMADLGARRLRMTGPGALGADPLRVLRLVRLAVALDLEADAATAASARAHAPGLAGIAPERVLSELGQIVAADTAVRGFALMDELAITPVILPELAEMHGVAQNRFHHRDVWGHTLEVLQGCVDLQRDPAAMVGECHAGAIGELLDEPLGDDLSRGTGLRLGALLHDVAKPRTRGELPEGRVSFIGHDVLGAQLTRDVLGRLRASERLRAHVAQLTREHLRPGFLVHESPLSRRSMFDYMRACQPVEVDVLLLSVADRLATRGAAAERSIARHLDLVEELLPEALRWRRAGAPQPLIRGDELVRELGIAPGPLVGALLGELAGAQYAGEVSDREQALALLRRRAWPD